uniref:DUF1758 domain-containing protein n=1 Tax=Syphacia muris TaxID=451379 RepID=A0A0N5AC54_9BILA
AEDQVSKVKQKEVHLKDVTTTITISTIEDVSSDTTLMCSSVLTFSAKEPERQKVTLAFFDTGSQDSFIDEGFAKDLKLPMENPKLC